MRLPGRKYPWELNDAEVAKRRTYEAQQERLTELERISDLCGAFSFYWYEASIEERVPLFPLREIAAESVASLITAVHGLYKPAEIALRNMLELSASCILFYRNQMTIDDYNEMNRTPQWSTKLLPVYNLKPFEDYRQFMLNRRRRRLADQMLPSAVNQVYQSLSKPVHSHVDTWHIAVEYRGRGRLWPTYHRGTFLEWSRDFKGVHRLCILTLLTYFNFIPEWFTQQEFFPAWELVLTPTQRRYLKLP